MDYELQKVRATGPEIRYQVHRADPRLINAARGMTSADWAHLFAAARPSPGAPGCHVGPVATGDKVVAADGVLDPQWADWPKLLGVEMEAGGAASAASAAFESAAPPGFLMIRGVSDLADGRKDDAAARAWRAYACDVAAAFAAGLVRGGWVPAAARVGSDPAGRATASYLRGLIARYGTDPARPSIKLRGSGPAADLRAYLLDWAQRAPGHAMFLVGEFGSGKSWALRELACDLAALALAGRDAAVPVVVHLAAWAASGGAPGPAAVGPPPRPGVAAPRGFLYLLDGLDEVITDRDASAAESVLRGATAGAPAGTKFVLTCRRRVFDQRPDVARAAVGSADPWSRWDRAVRDALLPADVVRIEPVDDAAADAYLGRGPAARHWASVRGQPAYRDLTRQPVLLRLLEQAMPLFAAAGGGAPSVFALYDAATTACLAGSERCRAADPSGHAMRATLRDLARLAFPTGTVRRPAGVNAALLACLDAARLPVAQGPRRPCPDAVAPGAVRDRRDAHRPGDNVAVSVGASPTPDRISLAAPAAPAVACGPQTGRRQCESNCGRRRRS